jgi:hypothetical protein
MDREEAGSAPLDERAAQEDLERLREEIARCRAHRAAIGDEFERFVRSFKTAEPPAHIPEPPQTLVTADPSPPFEPEAIVSLLNAPRQRAASATPALLGGALIVLVAGGFVMKTINSRAPEAPSSTVNAPEAPAAAAQPQPAPAVSRAAAPTSSLESAITTTRRAWMRVTVDGVKVLEREVPAGTRVALQAKQSIVIRTGDAGAVRLMVRGQDRGFLGAEGEVVTRTFTLPR